VADPVKIRARGYLAFCVGVAATGLCASAIALTHPDATDPAWTGWVAVPMGLWSLWVLGRAPSVGLVAYPHLVVHRTWSVSRTYAMDNIADASAVNYVGVLGGRGGGEFPLLTMVELRLRDGRRISVPEVSGSRRTVVKSIERLGLRETA
jgi:hypothetical protein